MTQHYIPCLPNRTILTPDLPAVWGYTLEQMQADRKQVREYALEEAAAVLDDAALRLAACPKSTENEAAVSTLIYQSEQIRSLK